LLCNTPPGEGGDSLAKAKDESKSNLKYFVLQKSEEIYFFFDQD
jgi:hypothetical protein